MISVNHHFCHFLLAIPPHDTSHKRPDKQMVQTRAQRKQCQDVANLIVSQHHNIAEVNTYLTNNPQMSALPFTIRRMYQIIGDPNASSGLKEPHTAHSLWTMLALHEVNTIRNKYVQANPQCPSVDIAYTYHGMGHIVICSVDVPSGKMYYRMGGGSDGNAVEHNQRLAMFYQPETRHLFDVSEWLADVRNNTRGDELRNVVWP